MTKKIKPYSWQHAVINAVLVFLITITGQLVAMGWPPKVEIVYGLILSTLVLLFVTLMQINKKTEEQPEKKCTPEDKEGCDPESKLIMGLFL